MQNISREKIFATHYFAVAGFIFSVELPRECAVGDWLPSFAPFRCGAMPDDALLFRVVAGGKAEADAGELTMIEEDVSDLGHIQLLKSKGGYRVEIRSEAGYEAHRLDVDAAFSCAAMRVNWHDPQARQALCSLLRVVYSQAVLRREGIALHASAVVLRGKAYLFMGKSGTGKSTHAALWMRCFDGCELLNDDNPTVRFVDGRLMVYGTPWSGKTPCYRQAGFPMGGAVRLRQAEANRFVPLADVNAFTVILPGCSVVRDDRALHAMLCDTIVRMTAAASVGWLECRPDEQAARICAVALGAVPRTQA